MNRGRRLNRLKMVNQFSNEHTCIVWQSFEMRSPLKCKQSGESFIRNRKLGTLPKLIFLSPLILFVLKIQFYKVA